jgi:sporulation protein YlmC with PRC-barrel domain
MKLVCDVLDKQLIDRHGKACGKVDGIILVVRADGRTEVAAIEAGSVTLAHRLGTRAARITERIVARMSWRAAGRYRIPWARIQRIGISVQVDIDAEKEPILRAERWLAQPLRRPNA